MSAGSLGTNLTLQMLQVLPGWYNTSKSRANQAGQTQVSCHMRYVEPESDSPYSVVARDIEGWVSFQVRLDRTSRERAAEKLKGSGVIFKQRLPTPLAFL